MNAPPGDSPGTHIGEDELIDLVSGFLDEPARERVVRHASNCAACEARFREISATHERGLARAAQALARPAQARRAWWEVPQQRVLALAAGFVVVAAVAFFLQSPSTWPGRSGRSPEPAWLPQATLDGHPRDATDSPAESLMVEGVRAYERRDLAAADRLLRTPIPASTNDYLRRLYLASTLVALGRDAEAIPLLDEAIADHLPQPWDGEWAWTLYVAFERQGLHARADSLFERLALRDDAVGNRARALGGGGHPRR